MILMKYVLCLDMSSSIQFMTLVNKRVVHADAATECGSINGEVFEPTDTTMVDDFWNEFMHL